MLILGTGEHRDKSAPAFGDDVPGRSEVSALLDAPNLEVGCSESPLRQYSEMLKTVASTSSGAGPWTDYQLLGWRAYVLGAPTNPLGPVPQLTQSSEDPGFYTWARLWPPFGPGPANSRRDAAGHGIRRMRGVSRRCRTQQLQTVCF